MQNWKQVEIGNVFMKIKMFVSFNLNINFGHQPHLVQLLPSAPQNVTGVKNEDGSITINFDEVPGAGAYVPHYGEANESDKTIMLFMGYTETNSWTLAAADVPTHAEGDKFHICVQAFNVKGTGATDIDKARDLHDNHLGSAWSDEVVVTV